MEGRDIGTYVFPEAEAKFFMVADLEVRAKRRFKELAEKGIRTNYDGCTKGIKNVMKQMPTGLLHP